MKVSEQNFNIEEIVELIPKVISEIKPFGNGFYDVRLIANNLYSKLKNTSSFTSKDLAGYLLSKNRKIGIPLFNSNAPVDFELSLADYFNSDPKGDDMSAQMRVAMSKPNS